MPRYYNKTRGPLPLSLPSGSTVAPAKGYIEIAREDEGCASVVRYVKKGLLAPPKLRAKAPVPTPAPVKVPTPIIKSEPTPAPLPEPELIAIDAPDEPAQLSSVEADSEEAPKKPRKKSAKKRTRR